MEKGPSAGENNQYVEIGGREVTAIALMAKDARQTGCCGEPFGARGRNKVTSSPSAAGIVRIQHYAGSVAEDRAAPSNGIHQEFFRPGPGK